MINISLNGCECEKLRRKTVAQHILTEDEVLMR